MVRAKKSLGQNFLRDGSVVAKIIDALDPLPNDTVVEIGPGLGALTEHLVERSHKVVVVEFDREMIAHLNERFVNARSLTILNADVLGVDFSELIDGKAKLVANLPYNISTPILQRLIDQRELFERLVLMFQREVVDRIAAEPGSKERGFLTVLAEDAFEIERLIDVPPTAFRPVPKVWSSVVRLTPQQSVFEDAKFARELISTAFSQKRKTLFNNLKGKYPTAGDALDGSGIERNRRAETLTRKDWARLSRALAKAS